MAFQWWYLLTILIVSRSLKPNANTDMNHIHVVIGTNVDSNVITGITNIADITVFIEIYNIINIPDITKITEIHDNIRPTARLP